MCTENTRPTIPGWDTNRLITLLELPGFARFATTREILSMPGKTAKVTITERQHDILRTIQNAPTVRPVRLGPGRPGWSPTQVPH